MVRSFIVLLLLVSVFFSGILIGIEREGNSHANHTPAEIIAVEPMEQIEYLEVQEEEGVSIEKKTVNTEAPEQATQKIAAFLEAGVKGFYEVVVDVLFQISTLFI